MQNPVLQLAACVSALGYVTVDQDMCRVARYIYIRACMSTATEQQDDGFLIILAAIALLSIMPRG